MVKTWSLDRFQNWQGFGQSKQRVHNAILQCTICGKRLIQTVHNVELKVGNTNCLQKGIVGWTSDKNIDQLAGFRTLEQWVWELATHEN